MADILSEITDLHIQLDNCNYCVDLSDFTKVSGVYRGTGKENIMFIGEAPSNAASESRLAFQGSSINNLYRWFQLAGYQKSLEAFREEVYLTSVVKCPKITEFKKMWKNCSDWLWKQIDLIEPEIIVLLGVPARDFFVKSFRKNIKMDYGGCITSADLTETMFPPTMNEFTLVFLPHPSGLNRTMNDPIVKRKVINSIEENILVRMS